VKELCDNWRLKFIRFTSIKVIDKFCRLATANLSRPMWCQRLYPTN